MGCKEQGRHFEKIFQIIASTGSFREKGLSEVFLFCDLVTHWFVTNGFLPSLSDRTEHKILNELDGSMMRCGSGRQLHAFLLLLLCLTELTFLPAEGRGAVGKGTGGRSFKGRAGRGGGRGGELNPFDSLTSLHWWQVHRVEIILANLNLYAYIMHQ